MGKMSSISAKNFDLIRISYISMVLDLHCLVHNGNAPHGGVDVAGSLGKLDCHGIVMFPVCVSSPSTPS